MARWRLAVGLHEGRSSPGIAGEHEEQIAKPGSHSEPGNGIDMTASHSKRYARCRAGGTPQTTATPTCRKEISDGRRWPNREMSLHASSIQSLANILRSAIRAVGQCNLRL
jgi:hypothetical protein